MDKHIDQTRQNIHDFSFPEETGDGTKFLGRAATSHAGEQHAEVLS
jgi:hypothetical protein